MFRYISRIIRNSKTNKAHPSKTNKTHPIKPEHKPDIKPDIKPKNENYSHDAHDEDLKYYVLEKTLLNPNEAKFYGVLKPIADRYNLLVLVKPRVGDVVGRGNHNCYPSKKAFSKLAQKHVDFLLCDAATFAPIIAVELDGKSHVDDPSVIARDNFLDSVYKKVGLSILHLDLNYTYDEVEKKILCKQAVDRLAEIRGIDLACKNKSDGCDGRYLVKQNSNNKSFFLGCSNFYKGCEGKETDTTKLSTTSESVGLVSNANPPTT